MNILLQVAIGLAFLVPAWFFAQKQFHKFRAFRYGRGLQNLALDECNVVLASQGGTLDERLAAGQLARIAMNDRLLEFYATHTDELTEIMRYQADRPRITEYKSLSDAYKFASMAALLYDKAHGTYLLSEYRKLVRARRTAEAKAALRAREKIAEAAVRNLPKEQRRDVQSSTAQIRKVIEKEAQQLTLATC